MSFLNDLNRIEMFGGRYFHNMLVHFPIGISFLVLLFVVQMIFFRKKVELVEEFIGTLMAMAALTSWVSVIAGHWAAHVAGYQYNVSKWVLENEDLARVLQTHRLLGFIFSGFMTLIWFLVFKKKIQVHSKKFMGLMVLLVTLLTVIGHLGATIHHL